MILWLIGFFVVLIGIGCTLGGLATLIWGKDWKERVSGICILIVGIFILFICFK